MNRKRKVFQDTVHGYISVPDEYCDNFIDTIHFQRLRRIEQTSMRPLYPSARHDRFIHSLGTFYLGSKIFQYIKHNSEKELTGIDDTSWNVIQKTYEIACLLHDCGHSPFSHTFEKYFDKPACLQERLITEANNSEFYEDIENQADAAPHEKFSAILVLTIFKKKIESLNVDPTLVARMIIGCLYLQDNSIFKQFANCFVLLLKGKIIDVDRLDYVLRDKWASGFSSNNINIERLLSSACIRENGNLLANCFYKNALSEIQSVIDVKNYQSIWIFNHHKVVYDTYILEKAIENLAVKLSGIEDKEKSLNQLFNIESFFTHNKIGEHTIYLPTDDDLVHYLKNYIKENNYAEEWLSRAHKLKPIWKSFAEFNTRFSRISDDDLEENGVLNIKCKKVIENFLTKHKEPKGNYLKLDVKPKIKAIGKNEVHIVLNDKIVDYESFKLPNKINNYRKFFFYVFIPENLMSNSQELIENFHNIAR